LAFNYIKNPYQCVILPKQLIERGDISVTWCYFRGVFTKIIWSIEFVPLAWVCSKKQFAGTGALNDLGLPQSFVQLAIHWWYRFSLVRGSKSGHQPASVSFKANYIGVVC